MSSAPIVNEKRMHGELAVIDDDPSIERFALAMALVERAKVFAKWADEQLRARMLAYAEANGEFVIGETRYYVGHPTDVECTDPVAAAYEVYTLELSRLDGDEVAAFKSMVENYLRSDPLKHGACEQLLGTDWSKYFKRTPKTVLKEGKPKKVKQLIAVPKSLAGKKGKAQREVARPVHDAV